MTFDNIDYDYKRLRSALMDYFGTAMVGGFPMAVIELGEVERASESELLQIARKNGFNLEKYKINRWSW